MKYAVPCQGEPGPAAQVCPHFGGAEWFAIIETDEEGNPVTLMPVANTIHSPAPAGHNGHNMSLFEEHEVEAIVATNMGAPMYANLAQWGLTVYRNTVTPSAVQAVALAAAGKLPMFGADETHQHGNGGCHH